MYGAGIAQDEGLITCFGAVVCFSSVRHSALEVHMIWLRLLFVIV